MRFLGYVMFFFGIGLVEYPLLENWFFQLSIGVRRKRRLRGDWTNRIPVFPEGRVLRNLRKLLESTDSKRFRENPAGFLLASGAIGISVFSVLFFAEGIGFALVFATVACWLPFLFLRLKLHEMRASASREGDVILRELLNQYKIRDCNMKEAIEAAAESVSGAPNARHILLDLAKGLNRAYTETEIRNCLEVFRYSLDTSWGSALASAIYFSHVQGVRVTEALTDLSDSLIRSRSVLERSKRENGEAVMMLHVLAPVSYGVSVLAAILFFGFTPWKFVRYQFGTALGLRWFLLSMLGFLVGVALEKLLAREKMDL